MTKKRRRIRSHPRFWIHLRRAINLRPRLFPSEISFSFLPNHLLTSSSPSRYLFYDIGGKEMEEDYKDDKTKTMLTGGSGVMRLAVRKS
jgi:hypothetical protein